MTASLANLARLSSLMQRRALAAPETPARLGLAELAGRWSELDGAPGRSAVLTFAVELVYEAQRAGEPVAWLGGDSAGLYPPDVAARGVDLGALAVVRVPSAQPRTLGRELGRAADQLARSGAFGLIVLDLGQDDVEVPLPLQSRLLGLAQKHATAIVCLRLHTAATRGGSSLTSSTSTSLTSLRASTERLRQPEGFVCVLEARKDKRRAPGWRQEVLCHGAVGLR